MCRRCTRAHAHAIRAQLHLENLGALAVDWLYSAYHYSHPPLAERLDALATARKKGA
jgi:STE24 endopeptidase